MNNKKCSKCGEVKSLSAFSNEKTAKSGKRSSCKECHKKYNEQNKEKIAEREKKQRQSLSDGYVYFVLGLKTADTPQALIEAKRAHLRLYRAVNCP